MDTPPRFALNPVILWCVILWHRYSTDTCASDTSVGYRRAHERCRPPPPATRSYTSLSPGSGGSHEVAVTSYLHFCTIPEQCALAPRDHPVSSHLCLSNSTLCRTCWHSHSLTSCTTRPSRLVSSLSLTLYSLQDLLTHSLSCNRYPLTYNGCECVTQIVTKRIDGFWQNSAHRFSAVHSN